MVGPCNAGLDIVILPSIPMQAKDYLAFNCNATQTIALGSLLLNLKQYFTSDVLWRTTSACSQGLLRGLLHGL